MAITRLVIYLARPNNTIKCGTTLQFENAVRPSLSSATAVCGVITKCTSALYNILTQLCDIND